MRGKAKQFLVLGLGRFGDSVARNLCKLGHEVLAVDESQALVDEISPFVTQAVQADATDEGVLEALGVRNFDVAVVSIGQNIRDSILISVLCKEMGVPYVIAKAVDELHAKVLRKVGVDRVVFPEREMGQRVAKSLVTPNILELIDLAKDCQLVEITLPTRWQNATIAGLNIRRKYGVSILAIHRDGKFIVSPGPDTMMQPGDAVLVIGRPEDIEGLDG